MLPPEGLQDWPIILKLMFGANVKQLLAAFIPLMIYYYIENMGGNKNLHSSRNDKADEFYTQLSLIENALKHYKHFFKNKSVLCNCDDPYESNFFKYFALNFNFLELKRLVATCYVTSPIVYSQLPLFIDEANKDTNKTNAKAKKPYKIEISEVKDENNDGRVDLADVEYLLKSKKIVLLYYRVMKTSEVQNVLIF